jgi:hypothetical protein
MVIGDFGLHRREKEHLENIIIWSFSRMMMPYIKVVMNIMTMASSDEVENHCKS